MEPLTVELREQRSSFERRSPVIFRLRHYCPPSKSNPAMTIKFNRIGNKLGLASLVSILLSVGMVANQSLTEQSITDANQRADVDQEIADNALKAESEMRNMQLAVRGVRLARTKPDVEKLRGEFSAAQAAQAKWLDAAISLALLPETRELFTKL